MAASWPTISTVMGLKCHSHGRDASWVTRWWPWRSSASAARMSSDGLQSRSGVMGGLVSRDMEKA
jgi:hypothetical protein